VADEKRTEIDWQNLRIFLALGRHGSLSAAARALGVNHATIARRLHSLEDSLGEKLVERRPEGFVLTLAGTHTLAVAGDIDSASHTLGRAGPDGAPKGLVRINAPPGLTHGYLIAKLSEMAAAHPGLDIDLATEVRSVSLERHEADIAVRMGRPDDGDVIAKPVATIAYGFYATAEVFERLVAGQEPAFITFDEADAHLPEAVWLSRHFPARAAPSAPATSSHKASQRAQASASCFSPTKSAGPSPVCGGVISDPFSRRGRFSWSGGGRMRGPCRSTWSSITSSACSRRTGRSSRTSSTRSWSRLLR
jgi:molybdate transport repressor ModE-like protein